METVIGAFDDRATAQQAVERLVQSGFDRDDVHVQEGQSSTAGQGTTADQGTRDEDRHGIMAFFARLFGTDDDNYSSHAGIYSEAVRRGSSVVVVDARDEAEADRASALLHELGAFNVGERSQQWRAQGWSGRKGTGSVDVDEERVLDVVQEELRVGKRSIDRGGVRVIQRVSQQPVRELIQLREERAVVDRRAVDRPATAEDLSNMQEGTMEIRETGEEAVVSKTARVVEEVRVGKEVQDREEAIEDTVRRKDVDVERLEGEAGGRSAKRERAVASDDAAQTPATSRDPDLSARKTGDKGPNLKDKPGRS